MNKNREINPRHIIALILIVLAVSIGYFLSHDIHYFINSEPIRFVHDITFIFLAITGIFFFYIIIYNFIFDRHGRWIKILNLFISLAVATLAKEIWSALHPNLTIPDIGYFSLILFNSALMFFILEIAKKVLEITKTVQIVSLVCIVFVVLPVLCVINLLHYDMVMLIGKQHTLFEIYGVTSDRSLQGRLLYDFLFRIYVGAFAAVAFLVTVYVAYIRHRGVINREDSLEYKQTQDLEDSIEDRFQEGVKLLGNGDESVRIGGVYVLWQIIEDAIYALPYYDDVALIYREDGNEIYFERTSFSQLEELEPEKREMQATLKNRYIEKHGTNSAQISAYKKAHSLHRKIFNILCGHIRTQTSSKEYLIDNYPSLAKRRFPKDYAEAYGELGSVLSPHEERPSNEIGTIINLFINQKNQESKLHSSHQSLLAIRLNLEYAVLRGMRFKNRNIDNIRANRADFSYCQFQGSNFNNCRFNKGRFHYAQFTGSELFNRSNCRDADFSFAEFNKAFFSRTARLDYSLFQYCQFNDVVFEERNLLGLKFKQSFFHKTAMHSSNKFSFCEFQSCNATLGEPNNWSLPESIKIVDPEGNEIWLTNETLHDVIEKFSLTSLLDDQPHKIHLYDLEFLSRRNEFWRIEAQRQTRINLRRFYHAYDDELSRDQFYDSLSDEDKILAKRYFKEYEAGKEHGTDDNFVRRIYDKIRHHPNP